MQVLDFNSTHFLRAVSASVLAHAVAILVLFSLRFPPPPLEASPALRHVALFAPWAGQAPRPAPILRAPARPFLPLPPQRPAPKLVVELPPAPVLETPRPVVLAAELPPTIPPPPLKTDNLAEARFLATAPPSKVAVQAAGFSGIETSTQGPPRRTLSPSGAFDSAKSAQRAPVRGLSAGPGGFSESTASTATVQSSRANVVSGTFGDTVVVPAPQVTFQAAASPVLTPVEILSKPRPAYTDEARRLQIEGEVLVEVVFGASGEARVTRVLRGLGHGLDESAVSAAREIRFHPAQRGGVAVNSAAVVHIIFQLAY